MEKEIKAKTMKYGTVAVLLAILLAAVAYNFGVQPYLPPTLAQMRTFSSREELENFLKSNMEQANSYSSQFQNFGFRTGTEAQTQGITLTVVPSDFSTTNVQVAGVDEADIVKTDGAYLYIVSGSNVYIVWTNAFSQTTLMHKIALNETYNLEIYVNGDRLAILGNRNPYTILRADAESTIYTGFYTPEVFIKVYDIANRMDPVLTRDITLNGTLGGSRMVGDYVYLTTVQSAVSPTSNQTNFEVALPKISENDTVTEIQPTEIRYISVTDISYYFTTVIAVNIIDDAQAPTHETFLAGSSSTMYVSLENMYLTVPNTNWFAVRAQSAEMSEETLIYRIKLDQDKVTLEADGSVPGFVLNQFSMDEYNGFFRIATTTGWGTEASNSLYVLNMALGIAGKLENLAPSERIYSARFMSDRVYLVTFRQIDPFYVIDLTAPTEPKVLGFLKIPGFSGYLHPYDDTHIIGLGKQDGKVKLSLFDVSNVTAPTEAVPSYIVPSAWSDSTAINDHKAFLFDKSKQLLAIPVSIDWYGWINDTTYHSKSWQGEYVFSLNLTSGLVLRGNVTHLGSTIEQSYGNYWIKRALYIGDVLYTVSDKKVKMNSLADLSILKEVTLA